MKIRMWETVEERDEIARRCLRRHDDGELMIEMLGLNGPSQPVTGLLQYRDHVSDTFGRPKKSVRKTGKRSTTKEDE